MSDDIRKVIYLDEIQGGGGGEEDSDQQEQRKEGKSKYLSESELKNKLESYKGRIPAVVIRDLYELLKGRRVTEEQVEKIVQNVEKKLRDRIDIDVADLYSKIDRLEKLLEKLSKSGPVPSHQEAQVPDVSPAPEVEEVGGEVQSAEVAKVEAEERGFEDLVRSGGGESVEQEERGRGFGFGVPDIRPPAQALSLSRERAQADQVYLDRIPSNTRSMMFLLKWIEYMIERVGYSGLEDVLDYYVDIGWISETVMFDILRYAKGIRLYHESSDWRPVGYMNVQDHIMSLLFIEALKTGRMNKEILHEVERQIYRIKKGVSEINGL
ncbi:MAG: hypothetical protein GXO67_05630 [Archaeoglobi archaeon]|nr:hypothetical protein [Archaeoglobi archaeon]